MAVPPWLTISPASGCRQGPMARAPGDLGPAHRHGRTSLASPRAVSAGCSRLIRTVSPDLRHSGRPRPPGTDLADHEEAGHRSLTPTHMRRIPRSARPLPWPELGQRARRTKASLCQGVPWVFFAACEVPFGRGGFTGDSWPRAFLAAECGRRLAAPPGRSSSLRCGRSTWTCGVAGGSVAATGEWPALPGARAGPGAGLLAAVVVW